MKLFILLLLFVATFNKVAWAEIAIQIYAAYIACMAMTICICSVITWKGGENHLSALEKQALLSVKFDPDNLKLDSIITNCYFAVCVCVLWKFGWYWCCLGFSFSALGHEIAKMTYWRLRNKLEKLGD